MKNKNYRSILMISVLAFLVINPAKAQEYMRINKSDGTVMEIAISDIRKITFDNLTAVPLQHPVMQQLLKMKLYPNPANEYVNIDYTLAGTGVVQIDIYSLAGKLVSSHTPGNRHKGNYTHRWQTKGIPTGTYICKISQNQITITEKVIVKH